MRRRVALLAGLLILIAGATIAVLALSSSGGGDRAAARVRPARPGAAVSSVAAATTRAAVPRVRLKIVASGLSDPVYLTAPPGDTHRLFVVDKTGTIGVIRDGTLLSTPFLGIHSLVSTGGEQGLLSMAFDPRYASNGRFYIFYTNTAGNIRVVRYTVGANPDVANASSRTVLWSVSHSAHPNHNGGQLQFGPDGRLYIGIGDGGSEGDPNGNGQSLDTLLGKMLRIAPTPDGAAPYTVPRDNPFVGRSGVRPEIWASGLRNPWRYSFDRATGDLWIGDVGQDSWEEIDRQPAGAPGGRNYGWNRLEGTHPYSGTAPTDAVPPVYEYPHATGGCAVTGGYVYRGSAIPDLVGGYVFGDFCLGRVQALRVRQGQDPQVVDLGVSASSLASFGQDDAGELYVLSLEGGVFKIVPA